MILPNCISFTQNVPLAALFPLFQANTIPEFNHAEQLLPAELPSYTAEQLLTTFEQNTDCHDKTIQILFLSFINNGILYDFNEVQPLLYLHTGQYRRY